LEKDGINAEVIDLRTLRPLDEEALLTSVKKTNRALVVQEAWPIASVGSWLAALIGEKAFDDLDAPVLTLSGTDCPYPYAKNLEALMRPTAENVVEQAKRLL
jgi:pyruvate dehydrogenase E1 component beta subunit